MVSPNIPISANARMTFSGIVSSSSNLLESIRSPSMRRSSLISRRTVRASSGFRSSSRRGEGKRSESSTTPANIPRVNDGFRSVTQKSLLRLRRALRRRRRGITSSQPTPVDGEEDGGGGGEEQVSEERA